MAMEQPHLLDEFEPQQTADTAYTSFKDSSRSNLRVKAEVDFLERLEGSIGQESRDSEIDDP